jgi:ABC-type enterobactin transport system permease subunit
MLMLYFLTFLKLGEAPSWGLGTSIESTMWHVILCSIGIMAHALQCEALFTRTKVTHSRFK